MAAVVDMVRPRRRATSEALMASSDMLSRLSTSTTRVVGGEGSAIDGLGTPS